MITSAQIEFNERSHRYAIANTKPKEYITSVTTIAGLLNKPYLVEWAAREAAIATADALAAQTTFTDARMFSVYRKAQRQINALNKKENERRSEQEQV